MYEWVQMGHRLAVLIIFIWIAYITWHAVKEYKTNVLFTMDG